MIRLSSFNMLSHRSNSARERAEWRGSYDYSEAEAHAAVEEEASGGLVIGIHLGTELVSFVMNDNGKLRSVEATELKRARCLAFSETGRLTDGHGYVPGSDCDHANTVFDVERLLGRKFNDDFVQSHMKYWSFKVFKGDGGGANVQLEYNGETRTFSPEELRD
ncbi:hypothetical protein PFISCL1PPCAC_18370 [Pristionchus fissidentatus]|uniref:Uncharacterized protein n=1 Tax=Pristionchus fissidentatus TaxID=1538716 RepID=A0AAV5W9I6_9BILA|nr:hypothetical protein PFISCL1PPCAC_18370 [Pristionchus fissidentatus]